MLYCKIFLLHFKYCIHIILILDCSNRFTYFYFVTVLHTPKQFLIIYVHFIRILCYVFWFNVITETYT